MPLKRQYFPEMVIFTFAQAFAGVLMGTGLNLQGTTYLGCVFCAVICMLKAEYVKLKPLSLCDWEF